MYEYKFVKVAAAFSGSRVDAAGYEKTVAEYAADGWRLVQIFVANPAAIPSDYQLILERPAPGQAA